MTLVSTGDGHLFIKAGSGKIKKKKKLKMVAELYNETDGFDTPYRYLKEYHKRVKEVDESGEILTKDTFENQEYFKTIWGRSDWPFILIEPGIIEELFLGAKYARKKYEHQFTNQYDFTSIPRFPQIEFADMTLPLVEEKTRYLQERSISFQKKVSRYLYMPEISKMWNALSCRGPNQFNLQIFFKADKKAEVREGLFVPLIAGDTRIPEETENNSWHIFYVKHFAEKKKSELYHYETVNETRLSCHGNIYCTPDMHFVGCLEDAIIKYGGKK